MSITDNELFNSRLFQNSAENYPAGHRRSGGGMLRVRHLLDSLEHVPDCIDAAREGDVGRVRSFLAHGGDPLYCHADGVTLLIAAVQNHQTGVLDLLLGTDRISQAVRKEMLGHADRTGMQALHWAVLKGQGDMMVRDLLDAGAVVDGRDGAGVTPLFLAAFSNQLNVADMLLEKGANPRLESCTSIAPDFKTPAEIAEWRGFSAMKEKLDAAVASVAQSSQNWSPRQFQSTRLLSPAQEEQKENVVLNGLFQGVPSITF